ncbi:MAG: hypothetical protein ACK5YS_05520 [bacterium]|jgi:hypothetical protein
MKAKILTPLLLILSVYSLKAQVASTQYFQQAFEEISAMLEGKQSLDFERAVFITENAYRENSFQYEDFKYALDVHSSIIEQFIKANDKYDWKQFVRGNMGIAPDMEVEAKERYRKALANYAIFTYLTDTLTVKLDGQEFLHLPYTYSNDDPFGTADWKNSQTMNLLETQKGNCYSLVTLFKILSERFKSEANISTAPQHIYIEHRDPKGSRFNVEVATRSFPDFGSIQTMTYTTREALLNDISMRKLDLKQSVGLCLVYLAKGYEYKNKIKGDEFILTCANTALQHDPKNLNALLLKAQVYEQRVIKKQIPSAPYEKMLAEFYKLGYRQMPDDMKEIILSKIQGRPSTVTPTDKTPNTFEGIGEQARVVTLSNGLFEEQHAPQKIVRYGQTIFDTEKSKIVKFLDEDVSSYQVDPVVFALSVDPLTKSFPWYTPYQFAGNSPILHIDLDGLEEVNSIKFMYDKQFNNRQLKKTEWLDIDRGTASGSFAEAAAYNTAKRNSHLYKPINQIHNYYQWADKKLKSDNINIRWFKAAEEVTSPVFGIGASQYGAGRLGGGFSKDASAFLADGNAFLFNKNIAMMDDILQNKDFNGLTGKEADYAMVEAEQTALTGFMKKFEEKVGSEKYNSIIGNLNDALNDPLIELDYIKNAKKSIGGNIDFRNQEHREALGKALVDEIRSSEKKK